MRMSFFLCTFAAANANILPSRLKKMKGDITMVATQLNPTQLYLLQLFSFSQTEESQLDLQNVLLSYYKEKVAKRANELWDKLDLDQHKLDEMCSIHERLPYQ